MSAEYPPGERLLKMPIEIKFDKKEHGVVLECTGDISGKELIDTVDTVFNDNRFGDLKYWVSDHSKCERYGVGVEDTRKMVDMTLNVIRKNPSLVVAMVSPDDLQYGISRMYQLMTDGDGFKTHVCRTREEADSWIDDEIRKK